MEDEEEDAGEVGAYVDPEELFRRFAKWRREQYEAELDATTNYRGVYAFGFNAANALRPYDKSASRIPELTSAAISASATVPVTRKDYLNLGGNVVTRRGVGGGSVNLGWRHAFEDEAGSTLEGSATLGARTLFTAATSRRISEHCEANFAAAYEPGDGITLSDLRVACNFCCLINVGNGTCEETSRLLIQGGVNKSGMLGFYDVAPGRKKALSIRYLFRDQPHECMVVGDEELSAPMSSHKVRTW
eukprot:jgi/Pico_ML_1/55800/g1436.t1